MARFRDVLCASYVPLTFYPLVLHFFRVFAHRYNGNGPTSLMRGEGHLAGASRLYRVGW